ncbi:CLUMA_CG020194, isoform A [Clunio marinus]|uniref:CLUMA_CG020194, isoform A n=1 Tax=Clunio marinus TaxID=568069 RepID=A0A1J1J479_9DIPT|nr:CLUMA_CG020194, isoform A [Clunio marinus]
MSAAEVVQSLDSETKVNDDDGAVKSDNVDEVSKVQAKEIIRYSLTTLLSLRSSKLSQAKPSCKNPDLSCMAHHKPPPKMLIANMMPKFVLNQMNSRGEESISPLSFHSNSSSSSNLSYQKRYQEQRSGCGNGDGSDGYYNSRYHNKVKNYDDNNGGGGSGSRIIYKVTSANTNNGSNIRFLKKAYNNKYETHDNSSGLISNKNILDNASRVITAADHRSSKKSVDSLLNDDTKEKKKTDINNKLMSDDKNNNEEAKEEVIKEGKKNEMNANELPQSEDVSKKDLKNLPADITDHLDDMFNNLNMNQLLPEKMSDERESSRFSKWFSVNKTDVGDEKVPDLQNNNEDISSFPQSVESEKYFQPIEKVESNSLFHLLKGPLDNQSSNENSLMHMIHQQQNQQQQKKSSNSGQVHSVEELEARLRQHKVSEDFNSNENNEGEQKALQNFFQQQLMPNLLQQQHQKHQQMQQQPQHQQNQEDQQKLPQLPQMSDVLTMKRPEIQALVQDLTSGEISSNVLWQRLAAPGLSPFDRDTITSALNIFNSNSGNLGAVMFQKPIPSSSLFQPMKSTNALTASIPMSQGSPLSPVPAIDQNFLFQQASPANKLRLSPLPATGIPQRIPSPRELQYHTQSIMQNALIRKKLEEQRENFRKRQEQEQIQKQDSERKQQDPTNSLTSSVHSQDDDPKCGPIDSPIKKTPGVQLSSHHQVQQQRQHAPSPNIFTPTSVLRKMTAEKESGQSENGHKVGVDKKKPIIGSQSSQQPINRNQQLSQQQFMGNLSQLDRIMQLHAQNEAYGKVAWDAQSPMKPQGRPIVKSAGPTNPQQQLQQQPANAMISNFQHQQPNMMGGNYDFQQQHIQKMNMQKQFLSQQHQQMMQLKTQQQMDNPALTQFIAQQYQPRAQHMIRSQQFPQSSTQQMNNVSHQMMQGHPKDQDELENRNMANNGGCLSPTSNQLAKWFSPELLADASAGKLPSVKANGQMLSLEEFERCIQNS